MRYNKCKNKHFSHWQGICMVEKFSCKWFSIVAHEDYCHMCNNVRRKYSVMYK